ncbi:MFS transporter [Spongiactinospora rosea]|uniref:MFS transporter n=1 Tax=Spongiactinospora rosea TaxID=2248750 RepID=UPI0018F5CBFA|nr:MFS transporter [Spongiactinospora rosea]
MPPTSISSGRTRVVLAVLFLTLFAYNGLETMLAPALPLVQEAVGATTPAIAWVFTGVLLAGAVATPVVGRLADTRDKRTVLLWVLAIVMLGTAVAALSTSIVVLTIGQLLQGAGLGLLPVSAGIIRDTQPASAIKSANGLMIAAATLSMGVGLLVAGPIVSVLPYTWLFWLPLALLVVAFAVAWFVVPSCPPGESGSVDWPGAALLGLGVAGLLIAITLSASWGWLSTGTLGLLGAAVVLLAVFVVVELRTARPLIDLRLLANRPVLLVCAIWFVIGFVSIAVYVLVPILVQLPVESGIGLGASATLTGLILFPMGIIGSMVAPLTGRLESAIGTRGVMLVATAALATSSASLLGAMQLWVLFLATGLVGVGIGLGLTQAMNIVAASVPSERLASVSGITFVMKAVGGSLGGQIAAALLAVSGAPLPTWGDFSFAFVVFAVVGVVAVLLSGGFPARITSAPETVAMAK